MANTWSKDSALGPGFQCNSAGGAARIAIEKAREWNVHGLTFSDDLSDEDVAHKLQINVQEESGYYVIGNKGHVAILRDFVAGKIPVPPGPWTRSPLPSHPGIMVEMDSPGDDRSSTSPSEQNDVLDLKRFGVAMETHNSPSYVYVVSDARHFPLLDEFYAGRAAAPKKSAEDILREVVAKHRGGWEQSANDQKKMRVLVRTLTEDDKTQIAQLQDRAVQYIAKPQTRTALHVTMGTAEYVEIPLTALNKLEKSGKISHAEKWAEFGKLGYQYPQSIRI